MKLRPVGWRVYLSLEDGEDGTEIPAKLKEMEFQIKRGMDENAIRRNMASDDVGTIVAIGPLAWMRQDLQGNRKEKEWQPWAHVGDRVVFGRHSGKLVKEPDSGEWLYLCND
jgi:co-chaperonin GroES (HSP10)